jgi:hypothetical protein
LKSLILKLHLVCWSPKIIFVAVRLEA